MKKHYLKLALPFALATVFSFPALLPDTPIGLTSAVVYAAKTQADIPAGNLHKLEIGTVTVYDFGKVKLHAYNTGDPLADEFYALESKDGLVLLESGAFKANVSEFDAYLKSLKKPLNGQLLSYHPNGYSTYDSKAPVYATEGALASWGEKGGVRALTNNFVQGFGAENIATDLPGTAVIVKPGETVKIAGIDFKILTTPDVEGNYSVEIPAIKAVYRHMLGSTVHNILPSVDYIDAEIADMKKYQQEGYRMILTSHYVPEGQTAVAEKIKYLRKVKDLVFASADKESFIKNVKEAFPDYEGINYLEMSASMLFPEKSNLPSMQDYGTAEDIAAIRNVIDKYADSITNYNLDEAASVWQTDDRTTFIHPRGNEYGWEAVRNNFYGKTMHDTFSKRHLFIHDINVQVYGDTAVAVFYWDFPAVFRADGMEVTTHGRESQVYQRTKDGWKIVHVHYSNMPVSGEKEGF